MSVILRRTDAPGRGQEIELEDTCSRRAGAEQIYLCPFHNEQRPSLRVNPEKRCFHCFSCGASGVLAAGWTAEASVNLWKRPDRFAIEHQVVARRRQLLQWALEYASENRPSPQALAFLKQRGLTQDQVEQRGGRYFPASLPSWLDWNRGKGLPLSELLEAGMLSQVGPEQKLRSPLGGRWIFPLTAEGELSNLAGRSVEPRPHLKWMFVRNVPGCAKGVFGEHSLESQRVIVTESVFDALAWLLAGKVALSAMGVHLPVWLRPRLKGKEVYLAFNSDAAGEQATLTWARELQGVAREVRRVPLPQVANDWSEYAARRLQLAGGKS